MTRSIPNPQPHPRVVHAMPGRIRLRSSVFADPALDEEYLCALIATIAGVSAVRLNRSARSLVVRHAPEVKIDQEVLARLRNLPGDAFLPEAPGQEGPDPLEVGARICAALLTPMLPWPVKAGMSWLLSLPTLVRGVDTLIGEGLKVEALDAGVRLFSLVRREYFTANTVGALLSVGEYLENSTARRANDLLKSLLRPTVDTVRVSREGAEVLVAFAEVDVGDEVICGPGEMIPVDGRVAAGEAAVNAGSITGESAPVHLQPGDKAVSGSVIEDGRLHIEAEAVGADTSMARISRFLEKSLRSTSRTQRRGEALADRLVPLTFVAGLGMYALTGSAARAASVLTVDYSCAIKLATPVAVRTAMHAAGQNGVLLKGAQALDALARVDSMVFDKTGTLTRGVLTVTDVEPLDGRAPDELLALAAGAEEHYGHPVARAVLQAAQDQGLTLPRISRVDFIVAHGVSAHVEGLRVLVGSRHFIHEDEAVDCSAADQRADELRAQGKTLLYVAHDEQLVGLIGLRDVPRPEAATVLRGLKALGVSRLVMLTGDHPRTAQAIAGLLPELDEVHAGLRPEEKAGLIREMRHQGLYPAFVGDGVNDSPALLEAEVGICMPMAADLARDAAQVVLMRDDLHGLTYALNIARRTDAVLRRCLWSAVGVNTALMGLAGAGILPTLASATLHNSTTVGILAYAATNKGERHDSDG